MSFCLGFLFVDRRIANFYQPSFAIVQAIRDKCLCVRFYEIESRFSSHSLMRSPIHTFYTRSRFVQRWQSILTQDRKSIFSTEKRSIFCESPRKLRYLGLHFHFMNLFEWKTIEYFDREFRLRIYIEFGFNSNYLSCLEISSVIRNYSFNSK
jgi:hypothetical protein